MPQRLGLCWKSCDYLCLPIPQPPQRQLIFSHRHQNLLTQRLLFNSSLLFSQKSGKTRRSLSGKTRIYDHGFWSLWPEVPVLPAHLPYLPGIVLLIPEHQGGLLGIAWDRDGGMRTSDPAVLRSASPGGTFEPDINERKSNLLCEITVLSFKQFLCHILHNFSRMIQFSTSYL